MHGVPKHFDRLTLVSGIPMVLAIVLLRLKMNKAAHVAQLLHTDYLTVASVGIVLSAILFALLWRRKVKVLRERQSAGEHL